MRRRAFPGFGPEVDHRYTCAAQWLRAAVFESQEAREWCGKNGLRFVKAPTESIGSSGGFLVPTVLANAILDLREQYGAFRRRARIVPMASDNVHVPRRPGGTGAYFLSENGTAQESSASIDLLGLTARKIGTLVKLSSEVEEDADRDMVDFVANEIAYAFAALEDDCGFNGDGTSTYQGIRGLTKIVLDGSHAAAKVTAASGHNTFLTLDATDLANLMVAIQAAATPNAAWYVSQTGFAQTFCRLSASGGFMYTAELDGIVTPYYLGFPVILCQKLPLISTSLTGKAMLAFGDLYAGAALGQRRGVTLARSPDRYLDQDQIAVLGTERFTTVVHDIGDNTNPGMLAVLVAP